MGKFNKDLTSEKHTHGLINSDEESSSLYIDPSVADPLYKAKSSGLALKGNLGKTSGMAAGEEEMSTYTVYGKS